MSYFLFIGLGYFLVILSEKNGLLIDNTMWLCFAILTGAEVIAWRIKK